jgi:hypothetical protein
MTVSLRVYRWLLARIEGAMMNLMRRRAATFERKAEAFKEQGEHEMESIMRDAAQAYRRSIARIFGRA